MKIKIAAAAPEILPGQPGRNMANVLAAISRARDDGASILVLPQLSDGTDQGAEAMNRDGLSHHAAVPAP